MEGKKEFYKKVEEALKNEGYQYYGEDSIRGIGRAHASKPDYVALKEDMIVIGEIKSPKEGPKTQSWRQIQNGDSDEFKSVRLDMAKREALKLLSREIGGHEIIIRGQLPDYLKKMGKTYTLPSMIPQYRKYVFGYSFPSEEAFNVDLALRGCRRAILKKVNTGNGTTTYIFKED
ncbi:MAG: hypothetical protein M0Q01_03905 [Syntrophales bacterium]|jgi:hypothetical protein|nr:hypothetical protein [Syntrophales bacterium]